MPCASLVLTRFIGGLSMDRIVIKPRPYRLARAGIQLMGGGRYSAVTQEVKDKKEKLKTLTDL
jgi:hypothetical protein